MPEQAYMCKNCLTPHYTELSNMLGARGKNQHMEGEHRMQKMKQVNRCDYLKFL